MTKKVVTILICLLGIASTFMPWVCYPKAEMCLYGYFGDGILTGFLFLVGLVLVLFNQNKRKYGKLSILLIAIVLTVVSFFKLIQFNPNETVENNLLFNIASFGYHLSYGLYVLLLASVLLLLTNFLFSDTSFVSQRKYAFGVTALLLIFVGYGVYNRVATSVAADNHDLIAKTISTDLTRMNNSLIQGNYYKYIDYNHKSLVASMGGKTKMRELLTQMDEVMQKTSSSIKRIDFDKIEQVEIVSNEIQVLFTQTVITDFTGTDTPTKQKHIAISDDGGKSWTFINVDNKINQDIRKIYPRLSEKIIF